MGGGGGGVDEEGQDGDGVRKGLVGFHRYKRVCVFVRKERGLGVVE